MPIQFPPVAQCLVKKDESKPPFSFSLGNALLNPAYVGAGGEKAPQAHGQLVIHQDLPGIHLQSCFPAGWSPVCTGEWGHSSLGAGVPIPFVGLQKAPLCTLRSF